MLRAWTTVSKSVSGRRPRAEGAKMRFFFKLPAEDRLLIMFVLTMTIPFGLYFLEKL
jgi:hypothetical protein